MSLTCGMGHFGRSSVRSNTYFVRILGSEKLALYCQRRTKSSCSRRPHQPSTNMETTSNATSSPIMPILKAYLASKGAWELPATLHESTETQALCSHCVPRRSPTNQRLLLITGSRTAPRLESCRGGSVQLLDSFVIEAPCQHREKKQQAGTKLIRTGHRMHATATEERHGLDSKRDVIDKASLPPPNRSLPSNAL